MNAEQYLSENLKKLRLSAGYTQKRLGEAVGFSEKTVSKWETGECCPSIGTLCELAELFGTDVNRLLGFSLEASALLGIDGGATKTEFLLTGLDGKCIERLILSSCNPVDIGMEEAKRVLREGITRVCRSLPFGKISCFAGISGGITGNNRAQIESLLAGFGFSAFGNGSDLENAVAAALKAGEDGIVSILGTGSITVAVRGETRCRYGGYGAWFDRGGRRSRGNPEREHAEFRIQALGSRRAL